MIAIDIPGRDSLRLCYGVFDFNGTLAVEGKVRAGVPERLAALARRLDELHVVTADTHGTVRAALANLPLQVTIIGRDRQAEAKERFIAALDPGRVVAIGNGQNDHLLLARAALGIAVIEGEGCAARSLAAADVVCGNIADALDLLLHPKRLEATLRS
jgi:soluble P-type ATPase